MNTLKRLEKELMSLKAEQINDKKTEKFKFNDKKFKRLAKQSKKKPEYALVQYLRNNKQVDFLLCKVISGNIVVINNKGHELNPKYLWTRGKYNWYIVKEKDTKPVTVMDRISGWKTDDHPILIKMVLGAIQKENKVADQKKILTGLIILGVVGFILYMVFAG